jgi:transposase
MRVHRERSGSLFSYISIEERIPASHPLRRIRNLADQAFDRLNLTFCELYAVEGRPSVPPEQLLLASLLQAFYGIRSERLLLEHLHYTPCSAGLWGSGSTYMDKRLQSLIY